MQPASRICAAMLLATTILISLVFSMTNLVDAAAHATLSLPCQPYDPQTFTPAITSLQIASNTTYLLSACVVSTNTSNTSSSSLSYWPQVLTAQAGAAVQNVVIVFDGLTSRASGSDAWLPLPCPVIYCDTTTLINVTIDVANCQWNLSVPIIQKSGGLLAAPLRTSALVRSSITFRNTSFTRDSALDTSPFSIAGTMEDVIINITHMSFRGFYTPTMPISATTTIAAIALNQNNNTAASVVGPLIIMYAYSVSGSTAVNATITVSDLWFLDGASQVLYMEYWEIISVAVSITSSVDPLGSTSFVATAPSTITLGCRTSAMLGWCTHALGAIAFVPKHVANVSQVVRWLDVRTTGATQSRTIPLTDFALSYIALQPRASSWTPTPFPGEASVNLQSVGRTTPPPIYAFKVSFRAERCLVQVAVLGWAACALRIDGLLNNATSTAAVEAVASHTQCFLATRGYDLRAFRDVSVISTHNTRVFQSNIAVAGTQTWVQAENGLSDAHPQTANYQLGTPMVVYISVISMNAITRTTLHVTDTLMTANVSGGHVYANLGSTSMGATSSSFSMLISVLELAEASAITAASSTVEGFFETVAASATSLTPTIAMAIIVNGVSAMYLSGVVTSCTLIQQGNVVTMLNATTPGFFGASSLTVGSHIAAVGGMFSYTSQSIPAFSFVNYMSVNATTFTDTATMITNLTVYQPTDTSQNCEDTALGMAATGGARVLLSLSSVVIQAQLLTNCTFTVNDLRWFALQQGGGGSDSNNALSCRGGQFSFFSTISNSTFANCTLLLSSAPPGGAATTTTQERYEPSRTSFAIARQAIGVLVITNNTVILVTNTLFLAVATASAQLFCQPMLFPSETQFVSVVLQSTAESLRETTLSCPQVMNGTSSLSFVEKDCSPPSLRSLSALIVLDGVTMVGVTSMMNPSTVSYLLTTTTSTTMPAAITNTPVVHIVVSCTVGMCAAALNTTSSLSCTSQQQDLSSVCATPLSLFQSMSQVGVAAHVTNARSQCSRVVRATLLVHSSATTTTTTSSPLTSQCTSASVDQFLEAWDCDTITQSASPSRSRRPPPPTLPPATSTTAATAVAGQVGVAVVGGLATMLASAGVFHSQRALLGLRLSAACGYKSSKNETDDSNGDDGSTFLSDVPLSFSDSPTQWSIAWSSDNDTLVPLTTLPFQRGTVAGNVVLFVGIGVLTLVAGMVSATCHTHQRQVGSIDDDDHNEGTAHATESGLWKVVVQAVAAFGLPGTLMAPYSMLLQPTVAAAVTLLAASSIGPTAALLHLNDNDTTKSDLVLGSIGLVLAVAPLLWLAWRLVPRSHFGEYIVARRLLWKHTAAYRRRQQQQQNSGSSSHSPNVVVPRRRRETTFIAFVIQQFTHREVAWFTRRRRQQEGLGTAVDMYATDEVAQRAQSVATLDHYEAVFAEYRDSSTSLIHAAHGPKGTTTRHKAGPQSWLRRYAAVPTRHFYALEMLMAVLCGVISALGDLSGSAWCNELLYMTLISSWMFLCYSLWLRPYSSRILEFNLHANNGMALLVSVFALMGTDSMIGGAWSTDAANGVALAQLGLLVVLSLLDSNATVGELLRTGRCNRSRRRRQEELLWKGKNQQKQLTDDNSHHQLLRMPQQQAAGAVAHRQFDPAATAASSHLLLGATDHHSFSTQQRKAAKRLLLLVQMVCKLQRRQQKRRSQHDNTGATPPHNNSATNNSSSQPRGHQDGSSREPSIDDAANDRVARRKRDAVVHWLDEK